VRKLVENGPELESWNHDEVDQSRPIEEDVSGTTPFGYILLDMKQVDLGGWRDLYRCFLDNLYETRPEIIGLLPHNENYVTRYGNQIFAGTTSDFDNAYEIAPGLFAETAFRPGRIHRLIDNLCSECEIPDESFELRRER
jgi:hypothetical protein